MAEAAAVSVARPSRAPAAARRWTIGTKLSLSVGGLLVCVVVFLSAYFEHQQYDGMRSALRSRAATYSELAAAQLRSAVAFEDKETAREVFDSIGIDPDLQSATVFTEDGSQLHSWGSAGEVALRARTGVDKPYTFELKDRFLSVAPIVSPEGPRGTLTLEFSKRSLWKAADSMRTAALLLGCVCLGLSLVVATLIARSLAHRLQRMSRAAERVADGDLAWSGLNDTSNDEIGSLAHSVDRMVHQLKTLFAEIEQRANEEQTRLEGLVRDRTTKLATRNEDLRRVLDNVEQGFLTIDRDGHMSDERSLIITRWLGDAEEDETFWDCLERAVPGMRVQLELGWEQVISDALPLEVALSQMPQRVEVAGRQLSLAFKPIQELDGSFARTLVVLSDVTAILDRERAERDKNEILQLFSRVLADPAGSMEFFAEANDLVQQVVSRAADPANVRRFIHTLKGNAGLMGLSSIVLLCHSVEDELADGRSQVSDDSARRLLECWQRVSSKVSTLLGDSDSPGIHIDQEEYRRILAAIGNGTPRDEIRNLVEAWRLESTEVRLRRLAEQAHALAKRLGKGPIRVRTQSHHLRLDPARWKQVWATIPHLVRNAVDHGLESREEREARGKDPTATLELRTRIEAGRLFIEVQDDGKGIDWHAVREAAQARGMATATQEDLEAALFTDGLTTRSYVTETSGRGVGMAALRATVEALAGKVAIVSTSGQGTLVRMSWSAEGATAPPVSQLGPSTIAPPPSSLRHPPSRRYS